MRFTETELLCFQAIYCRRCTKKRCKIKSRLHRYTLTGAEDVFPPELIETGNMAKYLCREFETADKWVMAGFVESRDKLLKKTGG